MNQFETLKESAPCIMTCTFWLAVTLADVVSLSIATLRGTSTYLIHRQACHLAELNLLVLGGVWL
jgi:hypothetical protein